MSSELTALLGLIVNQVRTIEAICSSKNTTIPNLNDPDGAPGVTTDPSFAQAADIAIAAATRLAATLRNPHSGIQQVASGMYGSALLNVVVEANVTEALKEAGPQGLHIRDLAPKVGMDPVKLGRVLRYLCAIHHTYRELSPNVFANNRLSATLDTGKPFDEVKDRGVQRYSGSTGAAPLVGHTTDENLKGAAMLSKVLLDPETASSVDPARTSMMKAVGFEGPFWEWVETPEEKNRLHRFGEAMKNMEHIFPKEICLEHYPWAEVPKGSVVVDVGGNVGGVTLPLAKAFPHLRFVIQDRPPVIADAEKHWKTVFPEALEFGLVKLQGHDFFEPQQTEQAAVYMLRFILHDWPDKEAITILRQLRAASTSNTKIVLFEQIVPYACATENDPPAGDELDVLHGNLAAAGGFQYHFDIQMMNAVNSRERTIGEWEELAKASGFKIESVKQGPLCTIVYVPV